MDKGRENEIMPQIVLVRDKKCEEVVLGSILNNENALSEMREFLSEDCFYEKAYAEIWKSIVTVADSNQPVNFVTVFAELQKQGSTVDMNLVLDLSNNSTFSDFELYARRLQELSVRRRILKIGFQMVEAGTSEVHGLDEVQQKAMEGITTLFGRAEGIATLGDALQSLTEVIRIHMTKGSELTGSRTGFPPLDDKGGLQGSDLIIIAGETSMGKTSLALSIAHNSIMTGTKIAVYSMEMTKEQLAARLIGYETHIASSKIMYSTNLNSYELQQIEEAKARLPIDNIYFDDRSTSSIDTILTSIRNMKMRYDVNGVIVDYLQILNVNSKTMNKEQAMGDASRRLKNIAKELNIWVIALSQLNRDKQSPEPNLNRLRDSGQIAEAADIVMFVYRAAYYNKTFPEPFENVGPDGYAMIDISKGRNIGTFKFMCGFDDVTARFEKMKNSNSIENVLSPLGNVQDPQYEGFETYDNEPAPF